MKVTTLIATLALVFQLLTSCQPSGDSLVVATAANTQFALEEIARKFEAQSGYAVNLVISSSGKHTAQIIAGAPYDLFISADMKYPEKLSRDGLTQAPPRVYAYGKLVLWSMDTINLESLDILMNPSLQHIAIPNPETAPYGLAAREALEKLNIWQELEPKYVFGESVAQTNQYIISGAAAMGFTASSIVLAPANQAKGSWLRVADSLYSPIAQGAVILKSSPKPAAAEKFYQYLFSEEAAKILVDFGYEVKQ